MATRADTIRIVKNALADEGFSPLAIAASLARFSAESAFDPRAINPNDAGPGHDSIGFNQWNKGRLANLRKFAAARGASIYDPDTQARFYAAEVKGSIGGESQYGAKLLAAATPREAAEAATSLARPRGWSPSNPSGGLGFSRTLKLTNQFVSGNFNIPKGDSKSDTGANTSADRYVAGPDRLSGPDAPGLLASISQQIDSQANAGQGIKGGRPVQGPPIPSDLFKAGNESNSQSSDESTGSKIERVLGGVIAALGAAGKENTRQSGHSRTLLDDEMNRHTNVAPSVQQILASIRI